MSALLSGIARFLGAMFLAFVVYLLSQAPMMRCQQERKITKPSPGKFNGSLMAFYRHEHWSYDPANWIYDQTPLHQPLALWAELWGVGVNFEFNRMVRDMFRENGPALEN